jgi:hypothetical protein
MRSTSEEYGDAAQMSLRRRDRCRQELRPFTSIRQRAVGSQVKRRQAGAPALTEKERLAVRDDAPDQDPA